MKIKFEDFGNHPYSEGNIRNNTAVANTELHVFSIEFK